MQMHVRSACAAPEKSVRESRDKFFLNYQRISQRAVQTSLEKQLDPRGPIASRGISKETLLSLAISPVLPSGSAHEMREQSVTKNGHWQEKSQGTKIPLVR